MFLTSPLYVEEGGTVPDGDRVLLFSQLTAKSRCLVPAYLKQHLFNGRLPRSVSLALGYSVGHGSICVHDLVVKSDALAHVFMHGPVLFTRIDLVPASLSGRPNRGPRAVPDRIALADGYLDVGGVSGRLAHCQSNLSVEAHIDGNIRPRLQMRWRTMRLMLVLNL